MRDQQFSLISSLSKNCVLGRGPGGLFLVKSRKEGVLRVLNNVAKRADLSSVFPFKMYLLKRSIEIRSSSQMKKIQTDTKSGVRKITKGSHVVVYTKEELFSIINTREGLQDCISMFSKSWLPIVIWQVRGIIIFKNKNVFGKYRKDKGV